MRVCREKLDEALCLNVLDEFGSKREAQMLGLPDLTFKIR
jgi:hypothetical protein